MQRYQITKAKDVNAVRGPQEGNKRSEFLRLES